MFCASYEFLSDGRLGHVFFSTTMLLSLVRKRGDVLHIDGTYRTTWANVIVVIPIISDYGNHAHPLGIAVIDKETEMEYESLLKGMQSAFRTHLDGLVWKPKVLIKDCADAITNGFLNVFRGESNLTTVDCWFHVKINIKTRLDKLKNKKLSRDLEFAIGFLQALPTLYAFKNRLSLFLQKYDMNVEAKTFLKYFENEYVEKHPNWFEAQALGYPSTNNAQESLHNL